MGSREQQKTERTERRKTDNFFLIHNYNTVPSELLSYCRDYLVVDASDDGVTPGMLKEQGIRFVSVENTGHNITTYFRYFAEHYEELPEVLCICKGNMLGRHCSREYFDRVYDHRFFTYLYEDRESRGKFAKPGTVKGQEDTVCSSISSLLSESQYIEENTSWYTESPNHPKRYFDCLDDLLQFLFVDPVIPRFCLFSPGACYILRREQIHRHGPAFYRNVNKLMNYGLDPSFPSEAHMVERILPLIFEAAYEETPWMEDEEAFDLKLKERERIMEEKRQERLRNRGSILRRVGRMGWNMVKKDVFGLVSFLCGILAIISTCMLFGYPSDGVAMLRTWTVAAVSILSGNIPLIRKKSGHLAIAGIFLGMLCIAVTLLLLYALVNVDWSFG